MRNTLDRIVAEIILDCQPAAKPEWLASLSGVPDAYQGSPDGARLLSKLRKKFSTQKVETAGTLQWRDQKLELPLDIIGPDRCFIVLRDVNGRTFDILGSSGCLLSKGPPFLAMLKDARFRSAVRRTGLVFLAFTMADLIALQILGLAAAPAAWLDRIGREDLATIQGLFEERWADKHEKDEELTAQYDEPACNALARDLNDLPSIESFVLVGWGPADLKFLEPAGYEAVTAHLLGLEKYLRLPIDKVWTWRPTEKEVEALLICARYGDLEDVNKNLLRHIQPTFKRLRLPTRPAAAPLQDALSRFLKLCATTEQFDSDAYGAARELLKSIRFHFVEPSIDQQDSDWKGVEGMGRTAAVLLACDGLEQLINRQVRRMRRSQGAFGPEDSEGETDELKSILKKLEPLEQLMRNKKVCLPKLQQARQRWKRSRR